jgi:outer membrane protein OmpA-like peptidoglycan-associated protein
VATPAALTPLAQFANENNMGAGEIDTFLHSQKSSIIAAVPSGFNLTGSLGINSLDDIGTKIVTTQPKPSEYQQRKAVKNAEGKWIWPLLLVVTFGGLIWFFSNRKTGGRDTANLSIDTTTVPVKMIPADTLSQPQITGKLDSISGNYVYDQGAEIDLKLADSTLIKVGINSTEARLFKMLSDSSWSVDTMGKTKNWISFDRVYFETGKAMLTPESLAQVKNIVAILKNFPAGSIKIGGYTDNTGDSAVNKKISGERAGTVMRELVKLGVASSQIIEAVGYGPEHPVCPANDTPECKARNRRVDLKVVSK